MTYSIKITIRNLYLVSVLISLVITGCSPSPPESTATDRQADAPESELNDVSTLHGDEQPSDTSEQVIAHVQVSDIAGNPLTAMVPIVTLQPNAFDSPVAFGSDSDTEGNSTIHFPADQRLYLRAWDPELRYFPNNFYDVIPHTGNVVRDVKLTMVEGGVMEMLLTDENGKPVHEDNVALMMYHPERGPWWPADAESDGQGYVRFENVPAGSYQIRLITDQHGRLEIPEVNIPPGQTVNLGLLSLQ